MNSSAPGRPLGVYIETKEPSFHDSIGLPLEPRVLDALEATGYGGVPGAPLILQSFDEQVCRNGRQHCLPVPFNQTLLPPLTRATLIPVCHAGWQAVALGFTSSCGRGQRSCFLG